MSLVGAHTDTSYPLYTHHNFYWFERTLVCAQGIICLEGSCSRGGSKKQVWNSIWGSTTSPIDSTHCAYNQYNNWHYIAPDTQKVNKAIYIFWWRKKNMFTRTLAKRTINRKYSEAYTLSLFLLLRNTSWIDIYMRKWSYQTKSYKNVEKNGKLENIYVFEIYAMCVMVVVAAGGFVAFSFLYFG